MRKFSVYVCDIPKDCIARGHYVGFCCEDCAKYRGFIQPGEKLDFSLFDKEKGFLGPNGCVLEKRPIKCLNHRC